MALCPLHKYLQNCTFRSFQYTLYCTSKLLLALEFKDNVSVTSTYNYVSLNNEIVVLKASSTRKKAVNKMYVVIYSLLFLTLLSIPIVLTGLA